MKKIKVMSKVLVFSLPFFTAVAQTKNPIEFGIKAGVSFSDVHKNFDSFTEKGGKTGFNAGAFLRTGGRLYFQPEANLVFFTNEFNFNAVKFSQKNRQLNVPLMVGYKVFAMQQLNVRVSAGPDLNYNLKSHRNGISIENKRASVGAVFNAGADLGKFTFDTRYSLGINKLNTQYDQKLNIYSASIGYKF